MIEYPNILDKIFDKLEKYNIKSIIVGGYIRDYLLNIESNDIDIEVYNISSFEKLQNILQEFGSVNSVGKSFGVCKLSLQNLSLDFTLPRTDSKVASGHTGFDVKIQKNLDFASAASRRDFSINAIGYDVANKKILDPYNGIDDLKKRALKMVDSKTFMEDPLRVLRGVQFCARFDLEMDKELFLLCLTMVEQNMLQELPKERIYAEIKKLLLKSKKPSLGFRLLKKLHTQDYFSHDPLAMKAIDHIAKLKLTNSKTNEVLMLASLCYNFSTSHIKDFLSNLTQDKELLQRVSTLVCNLNTITTLSSKHFSDYELFKLSCLVNIEQLCILSKAIYEVGDKVKRRAKELNILNFKMPAMLHGRDLIKSGIKPSIEFSTILNDAYEAQMHRKFTSYDEAIVWLKFYLNTKHQ